MSDTPIPNTEPEHIQQLRRDAEAGRSAAAIQAQQERTIAFLKAGVDPDSDLGAAIARRIGDQPITAESVVATRDAVETALGLKQPPATTPPPGADPSSPEAQFAAVQAQLQGAAGSPATNQPPPTKPGNERAMDQFEAARSRGLPEDEAREIGLAALIYHAQEGDESAVFNEQRWMQEREQHGHGAEFARLNDAELIQNPLPPNSVQQAKALAARYAGES